MKKKSLLVSLLLIGSIYGLFSGHAANAETIQAAVARSVANSDARKVAIKTIEAQNKKLAIAQGERGFTVELFGDIGVERVDDSTVPPALREDALLARQIALAATYPVWDGGRSLNRVYLEATLLDTEIVRLSDAMETIILNATQAYIDVYRRQNIIAISLENIAVHEEIARQVGQLVDGGKLSEPDRFQANDKLLAARLAHAEAKEELNNALANYQFVIGSGSPTRLNPSSGAKLPANRVRMEETALKNSYLLQVAQKDIDALRVQDAIDLSEWQPEVNLFLRGGYERDLEGTKGTEESIGAGVQFNWTIYKGGTRERTIARNRDLQIRAHYRKKQIEDEVRNLVRKSWNSYVAAGERLELLNGTVVNSERIRDAFVREFEAAKRPLLQVLEAERALFNLKVRRANADAAFAFQEYKVLAAQSLLARHFGVSAFGQSLNADFAVRVKTTPRGNFDISAPPLE